MRPHPLAVATILVVGLMVSPASASFTCSHDILTGAATLSIGPNDSYEPEQVVIVRGGTSADQILVNGQQCGGSATVTNTNTLAVSAAADAFAELVLSLEGGPFAPGAITDGEGSSPEIEFRIDVEADLTYVDLTVRGSTGQDRIVAGSTGETGRLNLDAGETDGVDADVELIGFNRVALTLGEGDDVATELGGAGTGSPFEPTLAMDGGLGNDELRGAGVFVDLEGGSGNDLLVNESTGDEGPVTFAKLSGGEGDDLLLGASGWDQLSGGLGDDVMNGGSSRDMADYSASSVGVRVDLAISAPQNTGGAGIDTLLGIEDLKGSVRSDKLFGTRTRNTIFGGLGSDRLVGRGASDQLLGERGPDVIIGGRGGDSVDGGPGWDRLFGGPGNDILNGANGRDTCREGSGRDISFSCEVSDPA